MTNFFHHFFIPRESNNHRPKILHHSSLLFIIAVLFIGQFLLSFVKANFSDVLGSSTDISTQELLLFTNQDRQKEGLGALFINDQLSNAALLKAKNMFEKNYWAHNGPDGTTPWVFIKQSGYEYVYAGENLARGFSSSNDVVSAWMASPSHRENMLSKNYQEVGFAVVSGQLTGQDTVLVVEMFGGKGAVSLPQTVSQEKPQVPEVPQKVSEPNVVVQQNINKPMVSSQSRVAAVESKPLIDASKFSWSISMIILIALIFVFILDMIIIERKKIVRHVGHNIDHIIFLIGILILVIMFSRGVII